MGNPAPPALNVAIQAWHTFVADLPPDTRMTLARLTYDISVGVVGATNEAIFELVPQVPLIRGAIIKASQGAADGLINNLAQMLETKLEAGG